MGSRGEELVAKGRGCLRLPTLRIVRSLTLPNIPSPWTCSYGNQEPRAVICERFSARNFRGPSPPPPTAERIELRGASSGRCRDWGGDAVQEEATSRLFHMGLSFAIQSVDRRPDSGTCPQGPRSGRVWGRAKGRQVAMGTICDLIIPTLCTRECVCLLRPGQIEVRLPLAEKCGETTEQDLCCLFGGGLPQCGDDRGSQCKVVLGVCVRECSEGQPALQTSHE